MSFWKNRKDAENYTTAMLIQYEVIKRIEVLQDKLRDRKYSKHHEAIKGALFELQGLEDEIRTIRTYTGDLKDEYKD